MTDQHHPITPPPELVQHWYNVASAKPDYEFDIATQAARWGADQELLACGKYLEQCAAWEPEDVTELYNYRRPKPPSLKEQALEALDEEHADMRIQNYKLIRSVLESLPS